jgi:deoxyribose-phosphate aldolase
MEEEVNAVLSRDDLAQIIDHTLLRPEATEEEVREFCLEACSLGTGAVCVSSSMVPVAAFALTEHRVRVATVVGFPSGAHPSDIVAAEARRAEADGADEVDMVMDLGAARAGHWGRVEGGIAAVRSELSDATLLKVILEVGVLNEESIVAACQAAAQAGAQYVKTSTGFHPSGGATVAAVKLMANTVGSDLGIKAAGGVRSAESALALVAAGATRLGMSSTAAVLADVRP